MDNNFRAENPDLHDFSRGVLSLVNSGQLSEKFHKSESE